VDLFEQQNTIQDQPLAERLRPQSFDELIGQEKSFAQNRNLIQKIKQGHLQSLILWGPPGCGKTSFANALINEVSAEIFNENAIDLGAKRIREIGEKAKRLRYEFQKKSVLFIDEIHRLNRGQQDVLLPFVEKSYFYLIGATTENPSYQLNAALVSRCRLVVLEPLEKTFLIEMAEKAMQQEKTKKKNLFQDESFEQLIATSHGDARKMLNLLEEVFFAYRQDPESFPLSVQTLNEVFVSAGLRFDKKGDEHYDTISVFIKSVRGSDPDAAIYYLARMLEGGEDPLFIARRLVILASEDIGNADPQALGVAVNTLQAVELVGMPEARISLAQAVTYLASAPKSNKCYVAINKALGVVKKTGPLPVPKAFRSSQTPLMKDLGYGKDYVYTQEGETGWLPQDYFPETLKERQFYEPSNRGFEKRIKEYLAWMRQRSAKKDKD
jgi:putative ATPase